MPVSSLQPELRVAAEELQRYLSDEIAPMMAVEHFEALLPHPPQLTAGIIADWIRSQRRAPRERVTAADLIYHALNKLAVLSDLELVRRATMMRAIHEISRALVNVCPEHQRAGLRLRLSHLGESPTVLVARSEFLHREEGFGARTPWIGSVPSAGTTVTLADAEAALADTAAALAEAAASRTPGAATPGGQDRGAQAVTLLLSGLAKLRDPGTGRDDRDAANRQVAQVLATAALESKTNDDLSSFLARVEKEGVATPMAQVFRALGSGLPGWGPLGDAATQTGPPAGRQLSAMDRIVALATDPTERARRWAEMIYVAIEQLNEGRLAQAVSILEVAKRLIAERRPDPDMIGNTLAEAEAAISEDVLRRLADVAAKHGLLRKVLEFFPSFRPEMLLTSLDGEIRREKRKLILTLLECHGSGCRNAVLDRLVSGMRKDYGDPLGYYRRNLACLLRRIPRTGHDRIGEENELLTAMIAPGAPMMSAKEAVGALGQLRHGPAEQALIDRLRLLETEMMARGGDGQRFELADRICAALARQGSPRSIRAVVAHAYNRSATLGDALARFEELSRVDLAADPEQLAVLLSSMRELASSKLLGFVAKRGPHELSCLMKAVAGTPTQEVRATLGMIEEKFKAHALGEQARKILAKLEPAAGKTGDALTGDLEVFGLPSLLQSLVGTESSGELVVFDEKQRRRGSIVLARGKIARCEAGRLSGAEAVYLFMEKPLPGTFAFRAAADAAAPPDGGALDPMSLILEGARRHDEYQQARAYAPDGVRFEPTGTAASRPDDESDGKLAASVWDRAVAGQAPDECELDIGTDPFRVRRLYAAWVDAGALRPRILAASLARA